MMEGSLVVYYVTCRCPMSLILRCKWTLMVNGLEAFEKDVRSHSVRSRAIVIYVLEKAGMGRHYPDNLPH
jgi:hypothetical protein